MTTTRTRVLHWDDIKHTADNPGDLHEDVSAELVYHVTTYYRAMSTGDDFQVAYAAEKLRRAEYSYWLTFDANPRDVIDPQDPAVIAAHAHHIVDVVFNTAADAVAAVSAKLSDVDNDRLYRHDPWDAQRLEDTHDRYMHRYANAYPSGPTTSTELVRLRHALTPRVIPS